MRSRLLAVVATAAVVLLLATHPVVADAARQITGKQIKNSSVTGKDVKADSLTGADVAESTLGQVPSAATAGSATTAVSAGNAATLDGQAAATYRSPTYAFTLPQVPAGPSRDFTMNGVPPGTYLASYSVTAAAASGSVYCAWRVDGSGVAYGGDAAGSVGSTSTPAASTVLVVGTTAPRLTCGTTNATPFVLGDPAILPSTASLVRVDPVASTPAVGSRAGVSRR